MIMVAFALLAGALIGILFFVGLWWTVQQAASSRQPGVLFAASFTLRIALAVAGFYFVGNGSWSRLSACLVGFIVGRRLVRRVLDQNRSTIENQPVNGRA